MVVHGHAVLIRACIKFKNVTIIDERIMWTTDRRGRKNVETIKNIEKISTMRLCATNNSRVFNSAL